MKKQTEKSQILDTYILLAQELGYMYLRNRERSSATELGKEFILDIRDKPLQNLSSPYWKNP